LGKQKAKIVIKPRSRIGRLFGVSDPRLLAVLGLLLTALVCGALRYGVRTSRERQLLWALIVFLCWLLGGLASMRATAGTRSPHHERASPGIPWRGV
jgi:cytochrome c oxidase assembly factor CtaG